jgi:hypothetical protein
MDKQEMDSKTAAMDPEFEAQFSLDREGPVMEALRIISHNSRPPAAFVRERQAALEISFQAKKLSDAGQVVRARLQETRFRLEECSAEAKRYEDARFPLPDGLETQIVRLEKQLVEGEREFSAGAGKLRELVYAARDHETEARKALTAALLRRGHSLGVEALLACQELDPDLLRRFPNRAPLEAEAAFKAALEISEIAARLDVGCDLMAEFYKATTPALGEVLALKAGYRFSRRFFGVGAR